MVKSWVLSLGALFYLLFLLGELKGAIIFCCILINFIPLSDVPLVNSQARRERPRQPSRSKYIRFKMWLFKISTSFSLLHHFCLCLDFKIYTAYQLFSALSKFKCVAHHFHTINQNQITNI
jgi:hypothetical protein